MFVDTLNDTTRTSTRAWTSPYDDWRAYSYTEQVALDSINRASTLKKILGGIAVLGGILMDRATTPPASRTSSSSAASPQVQSGFEDGKEGGIHKAALTELADSFEGEVTRSSWTWTKSRAAHRVRRGAVHEWRQLLQEIDRDGPAPPRRHQHPPHGAGEVVQP